MDPLCWTLLFDKIAQHPMPTMSPSSAHNLHYVDDLFLGFENKDHRNYNWAHLRDFLDAGGWERSVINDSVAVTVVGAASCRT